MTKEIFNGEISSGIVLENDDMHISSGGVANSTTINSRGSMDIYSSGIANSTTVNSDGKMNVLAGGEANCTTLNSGSMVISQGGIANLTVVNFGGDMTLLAGIANSTTVKSCGYMTISSGGTATSIIAQEGAGLAVTVAADTYIQGTSNGSAFEMKDAMISGYTINSRGYMGVENGGVASDTTVDSHGSMAVSEGGVAENTTINSGGEMTLSGVTSSGVTLSAGIANSTTVNSGGEMYISSGGTANITTVKAGGNVYVDSIGAVNSTTVNSGGEMYISEGGVASALSVIAGGILGGFSFAASKYWENITNGSAFVDDEADNVYIVGSTMHVSNGGVASKITVHSRGSMYISEGGVAGNTTVAGGNMNVCSSGTANNTTIKNGGWITISGGVANSTTLSGGSMFVSSNGVANNTTVSNGGMAISGGVANSTTLKNGGIVIFSGGVASSTVMTGGNIRIISGGVASNTTVSGGSITVSIGGVASSTVLNGGGITISSGGLASCTTVNGGVVSILSGGVADRTALNSGCALTVISGAVADRTAINDGGSVLVSKGGFTDRTTVNSGGSMTISGGVANRTNLSGGSMLVANYVLVSGTSVVSMVRGVANNTTVNSGGIMNISGAVVSNTVINSRGSMFIADHVLISGNSVVFSYGGVASDTTVNSAGYMFISSGGTATQIVENGGYVDFNSKANVTFAKHTIVAFDLFNASMTVHSNTVADSTTVGSKGSMYIYSSGIANNAIVTSGGNIFVSGGTVNGATVDSQGDIHIFQGGTVSGATVNTQGDIHVSAWGSAYRTTVNDGGNIFVSRGGIVTGVTINDGGNISVSSGAIANNITAEAGAKLDIVVAADTVITGKYNGSAFAMTNAKISGYTIYNGGKMNISSGGVASATTISAGGNMYIFVGGVADTTTVSSGGTMHISSGGVANSNTVNPGGCITISSGGVANSNTVRFHGGMYISCDGVANSNTVRSGGSMYVSSGGVVNSTTVTSGGSMYISSGGVATVLELKAGGLLGGFSFATDKYWENIASGSAFVEDYIYIVDSGMHVLDGGVADGVIVQSSSYMIVSEGGVANNTTVNAGDMYISGGVASTTTVNSAGNMTIFSGSAIDTTINSDGNMSISGGVASDTTVNSEGNMTIYSGMAMNTTVNADGSMSISGGTANSTTVNDGDMTIFKGGAANSTTVNGGDMFISEGGVASSTTVNFAGNMTIFSGSAIDTTINSDGNMSISGGTANNTTVNAGYMLVAIGGSANRTTVNSNGYMTINGGTANSTLLASGSMFVYTGVANSTTVQTGNIFIYSGGTASITAVKSDGCMYIKDGGVASDTTLEGVMSISSGGVANIITVKSGAQMTIFGGTANSITINRRGVMSISGGVASDIKVNGGEIFIYNGGSAEKTTLNADGNMCISEGGVARDTTISSGGAMNISSGGAAISTMLESGGAMNISSGGSAEKTTVNTGASLSISSGCVANSTTINSGANMYVSEGGVAGRATVEVGGDMYISSGGTANEIVENGGYVHVIDGANVIFAANTIKSVTLSATSMTVHSNTVAEGTTINSNGNMTVFSGGKANATTVAGGSMYISEGGSASDTTVGYVSNTELGGGVVSQFYLGGNMTIDSGAVANNTLVNSRGSMTIANGGTANEIVENGGYVDVADGANVTFASNTISGLLLFEASMTVHSNTVANNTIVNGGDMKIYTGGVVSKTTVNGGAMHISSGAIVNSTTVNSTGSAGAGAMYISSGAVHKGSLQITSGAVVSVEEGAVIDFTVAERTTADGYLINDLALIQGAPTYTITVSARQEFGTYKLAQGVNTDLGTITIGSGTSNYGTITVNGAELVYGNRSYKLQNNDGNLILEIIDGDHTPPEKPVVSANITTITNQNVLVTAVFSDDTTVKQYSINNINWHTYTNGVTMSANGTVYFRGKDDAGNASEVVAYVVSNIDKVAPTKPMAEASTTSITNQDVVVTATFSEDTFVKQYSFDNSTWETYIDGVTMTANGTVYFRGQDEAGNYSEVTDYVVSNIDKVAPEAPSASANTTLTTNKDVVVTATFSSDSAVKEYSLDNITWETYTNGVTMTANGTVYFRSKDEAGNISDVTSYEVKNIDKTTPVDNKAPQLNGSPVVAVNGQTVTISWDAASDNVGVVGYRLTIGGTTYEVTDTSYTITLAAGTYSYRLSAFDAAGNESNSIRKSFTIAEAKDTVKPEIESVSLAQESGSYTFTADVAASDNKTASDKLKYQIKYADSLDGLSSAEADSGKQFTLNASDAGKTYYYQIGVKDEAGNIAWSDATSFEVQDVTTPVLNSAPTASVNGSVVTITWGAASDNVGVVGYRLTIGENTYEVTGTSYTVTLSAGSYSYRISAYDAAGNESGKSASKSFTVAEAEDTVKPTISSVGLAQDSDSYTFTADVVASDNKTAAAKLKYQIKYADSLAGLSSGYIVSGKQFTLKSNAAGKTYYYQVGVIDEAGNIVWSEANSIEVQDVTAPVFSEAPTASVNGKSVTISWSVASDNIGVAGYYLTIGGTRYDVTGTSFTVELPAGTYSYSITAYDAAGNEGSKYSNKIFEIAGLGGNVEADSSSVGWDSDSDSFTAALGSAGIEGSLVLDNITEKSISTYGMASGNYQWSVSIGNSKEHSNSFAATASDKAEQYIAAQDSRFDLFFGNAKGIWQAGYAAEHTGADGWSGTGDKVYLTGKNKIADIFVGSEDANVLVLTDDSNGDALFVDDIFTALPDSLTEQQARFEQIDEIRAGAGDDVVDMTSSKFAYVGDGVKIYGGLGNDTIWANNGENTLFGDAGNDRIVGGSGDDVIVGGIGNDRLHGGGGVDTFCFGENWGRDTVEQLADGEVILWFENGSMDNWDAAKLTYTDGTNTVRVTGVSADKITLKFGDDDSVRYDELAESGCFEDSMSEKIFEDKNNGYLA